MFPDGPGALRGGGRCVADGAARRSRADAGRRQRARPRCLRAARGVAVAAHAIRRAGRRLRRRDRVAADRSRAPISRGSTAHGRVCRSRCVPLVSALGWFAFFQVIYGTPNPAAPYGSGETSVVRTSPARSSACSSISSTACWRTRRCSWLRSSDLSRVARAETRRRVARLAAHGGRRYLAAASACTGCGGPGSPRRRRDSYRRAAAVGAAARRALGARRSGRRGALLALRADRPLAVSCRSSIGCRPRRPGVERLRRAARAGSSGWGRSCISPRAVAELLLDASTPGAISTRAAVRRPRRDVDRGLVGGAAGSCGPSCDARIAPAGAIGAVVRVEHSLTSDGASSRSAGGSNGVSGLEPTRSQLAVLG